MSARRCLMLLAILSGVVTGLGTEGAVTVVDAQVPPELAAAQARLRVAPGLQVELWASEPLIQNPTSLDFDEHGRAYVVESHRRRTSVFDIRNFKDWVPDDLALQSVPERAAFLEDLLGTNRAFVEAATKSTRGGFRDLNGDGVIDHRDLEVESERIRLVWDEDQDGRADHALTFADGFQTTVSGVAAGVLAHGSNVWFTCIPDVWRFTLHDPEFRRGPVPESWRTNTARLPPGVTESNLLTGFGVHVAFGGHDLHGLIKGPDGRLYFSVADRGANVASSQAAPSTPFADVRHTGAIFRCEPDGSHFEVFARGLRNPQELAFDEFGNLWTGDNNGDGGDKARWTLVLEGADYGWTIGWQWLPKMGAWNSERLWHTRESNTAAYLVPPVAHVGHGPAGIAYYPGTGLGDAFAGCFFYCDFPGGVRTFRVEPEGAFFRVVPPEPAASSPWMEDNSATNLTGKLLWNLTPVDLAFPPGGGLVVADAFPTWEKDGKGRLWKVSNPALANDPLMAETRRLLKEGMTQRSLGELAALLGHADLRVRLDAQWELAGRGQSAWNTLAQVARDGTNSRARRHALWGLSQIVRHDPGSDQTLVPKLSKLLPLLDDADPTVQIATARLLGGSWYSPAQHKLLELIENAPLPVAIQAVFAYRDLLGAFQQNGHLRYPFSLWDRLREKLPARLFGNPPQPDDGVFWPDQAVKQLLLRSDAGNPVSLHAATLILERLNAHLWHLSHHNNLAPSWTANANLNVRLAFLLAERRVGSPEIVSFLNDLHPQLVLEAARAIHDVPIPAALPALAGLLEPGEPKTEPIFWPTNLTFTRNEWLTFVLRRSVNASLRLGDPTNAAALARTAGRTDLPESVRVEALEALASWAQPPRIDRIVGLHRPLPSRDPQPAREALAQLWPQLTTETDTNVLFAAFQAGATLQPENWPAPLSAFTSHPDPLVRAEAQRLASAGAPVSVAALVAQAESGPLSQRQAAFRALARSTEPQALGTLGAWMEKLLQGTVPKELQLDVLEAARERLNLSPSPALQTALADWTNSLPSDDPLAAYRMVLTGGDAVQGRRLFAERADWGCQRCHRLQGEGGDVGPDLTGMGKTRGAEYVLRAILDPNAEIAPGFENVLVTRKDGSLVIGVVKSDTAEALVLETLEEGRVTLAPDQIESRDAALSAMPEGLGELMTLRELRDLVAALVQ